MTSNELPVSTTPQENLETQIEKYRELSEKLHAYTEILVSGASPEKAKATEGLIEEFESASALRREGMIARLKTMEQGERRELVPKIYDQLGYNMNIAKKRREYYDGKISEGGNDPETSGHLTEQRNAARGIVYKLKVATSQVKELDPVKRRKRRRCRIICGVVSAVIVTGVVCGCIPVYLLSGMD